MNQKLKVSLEKAVSYAAAGLEIECYLVIEGEVVGDKAPTKRKHVRSIITKDSTTYRFLGKKPAYKAGSDIGRGLEQVMNLFKGGAQKRTRSQIEGYLIQHLAWDHKIAINCISKLRDDKYLEIVKL